MNLFEITLANGGSGGGSGADLIVTCDSSFAGSVITCTDGVDTFTKTCPSASPYTVTFESIPTGTWTISGVASGQTFSTTKTITDFDVTLNSIPDGATATPTDDIQTWLHCANIWDKTYTTISQVLNDSTTVTALITSNNAADYMARSTTWASSVCANSSAMTKIGANDYCANKLLSNSVWTTAIGNSSYFESVLTKKVPTMTSATAPSGEAYGITGDTYSTQEAWAPYKAFDNDATTCAGMENGDTKGMAYDFGSAVRIVKATFNSEHYPSWLSKAKIWGSNTKQGNWTQISSELSITSANNSFVFSNSNKYRYYKISGTGSTYIRVYMAQLYGRT